MIGVALVIGLQSMQTLAPPLTEPRPGTSWECRFTNNEGQDFFLKGEFPEAPIGWDPNKGLTTEVKGEAPVHFLGQKKVMAFESKPNYRHYSVSYRTPEGQRYTTSFHFIEGETGVATTLEYTPAQSGDRGVLSAFAIGRCKSNFDVGNHGDSE